MQSELKDGTHYCVDISLGVCTCPIGFNGKACKHQYAVIKFQNVNIDSIYNVHDTHQRAELYWLATGEQITHHLLEPLQPEVPFNCFCTVKVVIFCAALFMSPLSLQ